MASSFDHIDGFFESLGRAILILDETFRVIQAGAGFEHLVCEGASELIVGHVIDDFLQAQIGNPTQAVKAALSAGLREEGRRAFLVCSTGHTRLVSITAAPLEALNASSLQKGARYFLVIRPAEDEDVLLHQASHSKGLVAHSESMLRIVRLIEGLHQSDATVLITGESGTGKEVVARALHYHSPSRSHPFMAINCSAFPGGLLENELFGHSKGAYTGAHQNKGGRMEMAGEGTLFLDEIGEMPPAFQVKLLRVLQERVFERLGDYVTRPLKARIIAATNMNLEQAVEDKLFREDLYYRLKVVPIHIPPLRERLEDIEALAKTLLSKIGTRVGKHLFIPTLTMKALLRYQWPGNVRELENALEYATTFCQGQFVQIDDLPPEITTNSSEFQAPVSQQEQIVMEEDPDPERRKLLDALELNHWNKGNTATYLGNSRATVWRKMKKYGLN